MRSCLIGREAKLAESLEIKKMRAAVRSGRIEWQRHALERMAERGILRDEVKDALLNGERIEDYPDDYPLPSALFMGRPKNRALHVVAAFNKATETAFVITAYEPSLEQFEADLRTRRER